MADAKRVEQQPGLDRLAEAHAVRNQHARCAVPKERERRLQLIRQHVDRAAGRIRDPAERVCEDGSAAERMEPAPRVFGPREALTRQPLRAIEGREDDAARAARAQTECDAVGVGCGGLDRPDQAAKADTVAVAPLKLITAGIVHARTDFKRDAVLTKTDWPRPLRLTRRAGAGSAPLQRAGGGRILLTGRRG